MWKSGGLAVVGTQNGKIFMADKRTSGSAALEVETPSLCSGTSCPVSSVDTSPYFDIFATSSGWKTTICEFLSFETKTQQLEHALYTDVRAQEMVAVCL